MADIASLGIKVTTEGVQQAKTQLDGLGKAGASVAQQTAKVAPAMDKASMSAKQLQAATRQLPMQFTDIATGLASGQKPMQVLLQQGGQLKDTFGGIGPAMRASAGYITGMINPLTLAAAAVAGLVLAWQQGSDQLTAFNVALAKTGGYAGRTADDMQQLVASLDSVAGVSRGGASEALLKTAESGRFAGEQFVLVSKAAAEMQAATGQAVDDTIKKFVELGKAPVDALLRLNETEHFLTQTQLARVRALQDEGREQEAVAEAIRIYSDNLTAVSAKANDSLPAMSKGWRAVKDEISGAWGELGVYLNLVQQVAAQKLPGFQSGGLVEQFIQSSLPTTRLRMINQAGRSRVGKPEVQWAGDSFAHSGIVDSAEENRRMEAAADLAKQREAFANAELRYLDDKARKSREIAEVEALVTKGVIDREQATKRVQQIEESYARRGSRGGGGSRRKEVDEEARAIEQLIQRFSGVGEQLDRQIALYGDTSQAAAMAYDIQASGLDRVNKGLADQLRGQAQMLDMLAMMDEAERAERDNADSYRRRMENNDALIEDMRFELELLGMTEKAREREIALRYLSADATAAQREQVAGLAEQLERAREADQNWNELSRNMAQSFQDIIDGSVSAKDGIKGFFDSLNSQILRNITQDWADALTDMLKGMGKAQGGGGGGGGGWASIFGSILSAFGFSSGGYTGDGPRGRAAGVVHGQEYVLNAATTRRLGRSNLDAINSGGSFGGAGVIQNISNNFIDRVDRRSRSAVEAAMFRAASTAAARR